MKILRRRFVQAASGLLLGAGVVESAYAQDATYHYDALGRLARVTYAGGRFVVYGYDAAGNRFEVVRSDGTTYSATLQLTGTGPVNLRAVANAAGYNGAQHATITFQVGAAITLMGDSNGGICVDTGVWSSYALTIALTLQVSGKVYGGGGSGGLGGGSSDGLVGGNGGDAIYCRENINVTVNAGGQIKAGGGGGGGGGSWIRTVNGEPIHYNGGGGGGGFPNGAGGPEGPGDVDVSNPGAFGTTSSGGAGGTGGASGPGGSGRINGAGGAGGAAAAVGLLGGGPTGSGGTGTWTNTGSGQGGQPGYAIRKNGKTVNVTNNGTISGSTG